MSTTHTPCRSNKRHFATRGEAEQSMFTIWSKAKPGPKPTRAYQCHCGSWHLTSKPFKPGRRTAA